MARSLTKLRGNVRRDKRSLRQLILALQDIFFVQEHYALLIIFQGMDGAGKDGAIKYFAP